MIDARPQVGGNCTHVGTIPSKSVASNGFNIMRYQRDSMFQRVGELRKRAIIAKYWRAHKIIEQQVEVHTRFYGRNRVDMYFGQACNLSMTYLKSDDN